MTTIEKKLKLFIASNNLDKVKEIQQLLNEHGLEIDVMPAQSLPGGMPEVEENGATYADNARLKALALLDKVPENCYILGDDSGIEVAALNGAPGLFSARYAGPKATYKDNYNKMLQETKHVPEGHRGAQFLCVLVLLTPSRQEEIFVGVCKGKLHTEPSGTEGFGYDPIFIPDGYDQTFAQLGQTLKNQICHRKKAIQKLAQYFE